MSEFQIVVSASQEDLENFSISSKEFISILEVRLDLCSLSFIQNRMISILSQIDLPILFTYRLPEDSSLQTTEVLTSQDLDQVLNFFNTSKNFLDFDLKYEKSIFDKFRNSHYTPIYSYHNFERILEEKEIIEYISRVISFVDLEKTYFKFAVMASSLEDAEKFMLMIENFSRKYKMIGIVMGKFGVYSRVFGDLYGSRFTYCSVSDPKAPGQVNAHKLKRFRTESLLSQETKNRNYRPIEIT